MDRRSTLVGAAMRLHNYCIDRHIGIELREVPARPRFSAGGACASEIQPRVWAPSPNFGKNGEPVDFLDTMDHDAATDMDRCTRRDELKRSIENAGLKQPGFALQETA